MNIIKFIINISLIFIVVILLFLTLYPMVIYDLVSKSIYSDIDKTTNDKLNKNESKREYYLFENPNLITKTSGLIQYDTSFNKIVLMIQGKKITYDIDKDKVQIMMIFSQQST